MKNLTKRFSSLLVVMALVLGMIVPVHASQITPIVPQEFGTVTITNDNPTVNIEGKVYSVYAIFNLSWDGVRNAYSYTLNPKFNDLPAWLHANGGAPFNGLGLNDDPRGLKLLAYLQGMDYGDYNAPVPHNGHNDDARMHAFSDAVYRYFVANPAKTGAGFYAAQATMPASQTHTFTGLQLGYFVVMGTANPVNLDGTINTDWEMQAVCSLVSSDPNATVKPKADAPSIDKEVWDVADETLGEDPDDNSWGPSTDHNIGDTVKFRLIATIPNMNGYTSYTYTMHDTLSAGLTFDTTTAVPGNMVIRVIEKGTNLDDPAAVAANVKATMTYSATVNSGQYNIATSPVAGGTAITINFVNFLQWYNIDNNLTNAGDYIVVEYDTMLNEDAVLANDGVGPAAAFNPNKVYLEYSNNPYSGGTGKTPEITVKVYSFEAAIEKFAWVNKDGDPSTGTDGKEELVRLADAHFAIYRDADDAQAAVDVVLESIRTGVPYDVSDVATGRLAVVLVSTGNATVPSIYRVAKPGETGVDMVTPASGLIRIKGLDEGMFNFVELKAPNGFNILEEAVPGGIDATYDAEGTLTGFRTWIHDGTAWGWSTNIFGSVNIDCLISNSSIENKTGKKLPETGGIGRTIFTVAGSGMMLAAAVVMIAKRKTRLQ